MPSSVYSVRAWDIPDRMDLEAQPRRETIESYVLTRAAERAWHKFNQHLEAGQGALWWIGGPGGCGKTHFLNYVIALQHRAGAMTAESSRRTTCGFELAGRVGAAEIEAYLLSVLAEQIGVHDEAGGLWRALRGAPAIEIALEQAARVGIHAITIAIDFALADCRSAEEYFDAVAAVAANAKRARCRFNVLVAARIHAPRSAAPLDIAAADSIECVDAAIRRTRDLNDAGATTVDRAYAGIEMLGFDPRAIYPFHPRAAAVLPAIAGPPATIAAIARIARDAELAHRERGYDPARVIFPADVVACAALAEHLATRLGDSGAAAHRIARGAADAFTGHEAELAREMVDTLIVEHLAGGVAITITEIEAQLPILASRIGEAWTRPALEGVLKRLTAQTRGVIRFDPQGARFDPAAAAEPEVALFNSALALVRRFEPTLGPAREVPELGAKINRLQLAMAAAADSAARVERVLAAATREIGIAMSAEQNRTISAFIALAQNTAHETIEIGADPVRSESAFKTVTAYESIAAAAAIVPRMRAMREYLAATGLRASNDGLSSRDPAIVVLETECELLVVETGPRALSAIPRSLDALQARFQKFKWTYVQRYRLAHENWRAELARLLPALEDARRHLEAIRRLNAISALGPPEGLDLQMRLNEVAARLTRCDFDGPLTPETTPRCVSCGFTLGTDSPRGAIEDVMEGLRRAISVKLAALSQSVIAALIREHDTGHRLEGVLKIIQASQTDALVRVLDDRLARYLAQLLDDNLGSAATPAKEPLALIESDAGKPPRRKLSIPRPSGTSGRAAPRTRSK